MAARDLFGATYVTLGILDLDDHTVQRVVTCGRRTPTTGSRPATQSPGYSRTVVTKRRTVRGDNPGGDPAELQLPLLHPGVQAFLAAPIASPAHVYGWICLVGNEGRTFTEDDEQLVDGAVWHRSAAFTSSKHEVTRARNTPSRRCAMSGTGPSDISTPPK